MGEEAAPDDGIVRVVELEQERLARRQRVEFPVPAGLPEVDLVEIRPPAQEPYQSLSVTATHARMAQSYNGHWLQ